jgi:hypothetical protein
MDETEKVSELISIAQNIANTLSIKEILDETGVELHPEEVQQIIQQARSLALQILEIPNTPPIEPNHPELVGFIKSEIQQILENQSILDSVEYASYKIKPTALTVFYYSLLLVDEASLFKLYMAWLNLKQLWVLLVQQYNETIDPGSFIHYILSIHDLFYKFSSPIIKEVQGGGRNMSVHVFLVALWILSLSVTIDSIQPKVSMVPLTRNVAQFKPSGEFFKNVNEKFKTMKDRGTQFAVSFLLDRLAENCGSSPQARTEEGQRIFSLGVQSLNLAAGVSSYELVQGTSKIGHALTKWSNPIPIVQYIPSLFSTFTTDMTDYTKIPIGLRKLGVTTGDIYRISMGIQYAFNVTLPQYEKFLAIVGNPEKSDAAQFRDDVLDMVKKGTIPKLAIQGVMSTIGLGALGPILITLLQYFPTMNDKKKLRSQLEKMKYINSKLSTLDSYILMLKGIDKNLSGLSEQQFAPLKPVSHYLGFNPSGLDANMQSLEGGTRSKHKKTKRRRRRMKSKRTHHKM